MSLRNLPYAIFLLLLSVAAAAARQANMEYGQAGELKGVTRLFVSTGMDMSSRAQLVRELLRRLPHVTITEAPEGADVHLIYRSERLHVPGALTWAGEPAHEATDRQVYGGPHLSLKATQLVPVVVGTGAVLKPAGPGRVRLLMSFRGESLSGSFERSPGTNFVRAFVKEYRRANQPAAGAR